MSEQRDAIFGCVFRCYVLEMTFSLVIDREEDGRWIASVEGLPGVNAYGSSRDDAISHAIALTFARLADEVENGERDAHTLMTVSFTETAAA